MTSSEFNQQMGALIRSMEQKVRQNPSLAQEPVSVWTGGRDANDKIEEAIIALIALYLKLRALDGS